MTVAKYCKEKGMTKEEYRQFSSNIKATATAIIESLKPLYPENTYHPTVGAITRPGACKDIECLIINELKAQGLEFIENNTYWRF